MLTKRSLAALIILRKNGGVPDASNKLRYDERSIWMLIDSAIAEVVNYDYGINHERLKDEWIKGFKAKVKWDCSYQKAYIKLPARLISLPDDAGLHEIAPALDVTTPWILEKNGAAGIFAALESNNVGPGRYVCRLEGNIIWVDKFSEYDVNLGCVVVVRMVAGTDGYKPNEVLRIPDTAAEGRVMDVITRRLDDLRPVAEKQINDGNPMTP